MEKVTAVFVLCGWMACAIPAGAQFANTQARDPTASHVQPETLLYSKVPDFSFASATLAGHSLGELGLKYRKLLLFAPSADDPLFQRQIHLLGAPAARAGMKERDMILIPVLQQGGFADPAADASLDAAAAAKIAAAYGIAPGSFAALLVGRTNVLKSWSDKPYAPEFLFELIDSLPMRRHEAQAAAR